MTTPDHDESKPRRRWPTYLAIVLVLVFMVYPLSIGPAYVMAMYLNAEPIWVTAYSPVGIAAKEIGAYAELMDYCQWWIKMANASPFPPT